MKYSKIVLVVVLVVFIGSCSLFESKSTYYYVVSSGCNYHGCVKYATPSGLIEDNDCSLLYFTTKAYKFDHAYGLVVNAVTCGASSLPCMYNNITVTIMKGGSEGSIGSGGTVVATQTGQGAATATAVAD